MLVPHCLVSSAHPRYLLHGRGWKHVDQNDCQQEIQIQHYSSSLSIYPASSHIIIYTQTQDHGKSEVHVNMCDIKTINNTNGIQPSIQSQIITCQVSDVWLTDVWLTEFLLIFFLEQVFTYFHIISTKYFFFVSDLTSRGGLLYTHSTHTVDLLYGIFSILISTYTFDSSIQCCVRFLPRGECDLLSSRSHLLLPDWLQQPRHGSWTR